MVDKIRMLLVKSDNGYGLEIYVMTALNCPVKFVIML